MYLWRDFFDNKNKLKNEKTNLGNETLKLHIAELLMKLIIKIYTLC